MKDSTDIRSETLDKHATEAKIKSLMGSHRDSGVKLMAEVVGKFGRIPAHQRQPVNRLFQNDNSLSAHAETRSECLLYRQVTKVVSILPIVIGDMEGDFDDCHYDRENKIEALKKHADNIVIPNEIRAKGRELTKEEQARKTKIRSGKLWKKSLSVVPPKSNLKKQGTITDGKKKKVQFSTKKTVFKYTPNHV